MTTGAHREKQKKLFYNSVRYKLGSYRSTHKFENFDCAETEQVGKSGAIRSMNF